MKTVRVPLTPGGSRSAPPRAWAEVAVVERVGELWAVTKALGCPHNRGRIWRVVHIPTGCTAGRYLFTKAEARMLALRLSKVCTETEWATATEVNQIPIAALDRVHDVVLAEISAMARSTHGQGWGVPR